MPADLNTARHAILEQDNPAAVLIAWGGDDENMPMGSWPTNNAAAFLAAIADELSYAGSTGCLITVYRGDNIVDTERL